MFAEMKDRWTDARAVLEQAMAATVTGTDVTVQSLGAAANLYRNSELENQQIMHKIGLNLGMGQ